MKSRCYSLLILFVLTWPRSVWLLSWASSLPLRWHEAPSSPSAHKKNTCWWSDRPIDGCRTPSTYIQRVSTSWIETLVRFLTMGVQLWYVVQAVLRRRMNGRSNRCRLHPSIQQLDVPIQLKEKPRFQSRSGKIVVQSSINNQDVIIRFYLLLLFPLPLHFQQHIQHILTNTQPAFVTQRCLKMAKKVPLNACF